MINNNNQPKKDMTFWTATITSTIKSNDGTFHTYGKFTFDKSVLRGRTPLAYAWDFSKNYTSDTDIKIQVTEF